MQNYIFVEKQLSIQPKNYFYLSNGQIIKHIEELPDVLEKADASVFNNHVTPFKNDFAKWIYEVHSNSHLSQLLSQVKSREETIRILRAYLKQKDKTGSNENLFVNKESNNLFKSAQDQMTVNISQPPQTNEPAQQEKTVSAILPNQAAVYSQPAQSSQNSNISVPKRIYVWKTQESSVWVSKSQRKEEEQKKQQIIPENNIPVETNLAKTEKKEEKKQEEKAAEIPKITPLQQVPKTESKEIRQEQVSKEIKPEVTSFINLKAQPEEIKSPANADEFFMQNPVTMGQLIDAKKKTLTIDPLEMINYSDRDAPSSLVEQFKETYSKTYQRMVYLRKSGFDTSLAELMIQRIPSKIKILDSSKELKDAIIIKRYLNETIEELNNVK
jgi:hypothetical protein